MKAMLIKSPDGLRGSTPADQDAWARFARKLEVMKPGTCLRMEWSRPRNGPQHRRLFALLQVVAENSEIYDTREKALVAVKLAAGYCDDAIDPRTGKAVPIVQSIRYEAMDQQTFERFYAAALDAVLQVILPGMDRATLQRLIAMVEEGWA
ncbi:DUF1367 family protein [Acidovorax sp. LjRoot118]|uniref:hypothetical protein n=1 Tax=Acidovorax sp. LjRoot118 TaxID=3342256 RepID=UPI003ECCC13A